jgi:hypothetical protein
LSVAEAILPGPWHLCATNKAFFDFSATQSVEEVPGDRKMFAGAGHLGDGSHIAAWLGVDLRQFLKMQGCRVA